jgi:cytochrome P450
LRSRSDLANSSGWLTWERDEELGTVADVRRHHWPAHSPHGFTNTSYEDAVAVLRDRRFHSALSLLPQLAGQEPGGHIEGRRRSILSMGSEEHARLPGLVAPAFTPAAIATGSDPSCRAVISSLADVLAPGQTCDLVADVCEPYPIPIICELLGAPKDDWKLFSACLPTFSDSFNQDLVTDLPTIEWACDELDTNVILGSARSRSHCASEGQYAHPCWNT